MNVRQKLRQRHATLMAIFLGGLVIGAVSFLVGGLLDLDILLIFPGIIGLAALSVPFAAYWFAFRCPVCRENLAPLFLNRAYWSAQVRYCPFCGEDFEALEEEE